MSLPVIEIQNLTKNWNEALILSTVLKGKKHGYQMAVEVEERSSGRFKFNHGTLYPILHKLEKEGLIKGSWKEEGSKRKRKYYAITSKGKKYLGTRVEDWHALFSSFFSIIDEAEK